jgi:hypothetical protein
LDQVSLARGVRFPLDVETLSKESDSMVPSRADIAREA